MSIYPNIFDSMFLGCNLESYYYSQVEMHVQ